MSGKGAPKGNKYAAKESTGKPLTLYLTSEDMELLRIVQTQHNQDTSDKACRKLARKAAKSGINALLLPHRYDEVLKIESEE